MFFKKFLNKFIYYLNTILIIPLLFINIFRKTPYKFVRIRRDTIGNGASELYLYLNIFKKRNNHLYFFDDEYVCNNCLNLIYKKNYIKHPNSKNMDTWMFLIEELKSL